MYDQLAVVPYGDNPIAGARLGAVVSLAANRTLPVRTGLPLRRPRMGTQVVAIGRDGQPAWSPFAKSMAWRPHGGPRLLNWTVPSDQLLPVGPGQFQLNERWLVEVIEAGLWLREVDNTSGAAVVRQLPIRSKYCAVVVGGFDDNQARPPWRAIVKLIRQLPEDALERLRLAVPQAVGQKLARAAARACQHVLEGRPVYVVTADGNLVRFADSARDARAPRERVLSPPMELRRPVEFIGRDTQPAESSRRRSASRRAKSTADTGRDTAASRAATSEPKKVPTPPTVPAAQPAVEPAQEVRATPAKRPVPPPAVAVPDHVVRESHDEAR